MLYDSIFSGGILMYSNSLNKLKVHECEKSLMLVILSSFLFVMLIGLSVVHADVSEQSVDNSSSTVVSDSSSTQVVSKARSAAPVYVTQSNYYNNLNETDGTTNDSSSAQTENTDTSKTSVNDVPVTVKNNSNGEATISVTPPKVKPVNANALSPKPTSLNNCANKEIQSKFETTTNLENNTALCQNNSLDKLTANTQQSNTSGDQYQKVIVQNPEPTKTVQKSIHALYSPAKQQIVGTKKNKPYFTMITISTLLIVVVGGTVMIIKKTTD